MTTIIDTPVEQAELAALRWDILATGIKQEPVVPRKVKATSAAVQKIKDVTGLSINADEFGNWIIEHSSGKSVEQIAVFDKAASYSAVLNVLDGMKKVWSAAYDTAFYEGWQEGWDDGWSERSTSLGKEFVGEIQE